MQILQDLSVFLSSAELILSAVLHIVDIVAGEFISRSDIKLVISDCNVFADTVILLKDNFFILM